MGGTYNNDMDESDDEQQAPWSEYLPRDPEITALVQQLAANGLVLSQIESLIKRALQDKLDEIRSRDGEYDEVAWEVLEDLLVPTKKRQH